MKKSNGWLVFDDLAVPERLVTCVREAADGSTCLTLSHRTPSGDLEETTSKEPYKTAKDAMI
jgi:hypothetical protein